MSDTSLNVLDMMKHSTSSDGTTPEEDLFLRKEPQRQQESDIGEKPSHEPPKKKAWVPDAELTKGMAELHQEPVTYTADEIKTDDDGPLRNLSDDDAIEASGDQQDEMSRMMSNIECAKQRFGIAKLQIPPGKFQTIVYNAASDTDPVRAAAKLDEFFREMIDTYPEFIYEWVPKKTHETLSDPQASEQPDDATAEVEEYVADETDNNGIESASASINADKDEVQVIIDKRNLPEIAWSKEDVDKVRKARTVELNIIEEKAINFSEIDDADQNTVDRVISQYVRKNNDIAVSLPASRYRCTVTGLSYPEILDLSNSTEMNNLDGERKKWSICFNHMKNPSIGPWQEYRYYIHPVSKRRVKLGPNESAPSDLYPAPEIHVYTKFEDFLRHTSFMDLEFMIWKILCATCLSTEIIQIDCHAALKNGGQCNNNYDWIYSPAELLEEESVSPEVIEEMRITGEVGGADILNNYNDSFVMKSRTVQLPESGLLAVFGHASAYDYLEVIYPAMMNIEAEGSDPTTAASRSLNYTALTIIKGFLTRNNETGRYERITDIDDMIGILSNMGEIDWLTVGELVSMSMKPYDFKYSLRGLVCPKCKNKSRISIDNMSKLLFIVARSLSSVQVTFKTI